MRTTPAPFSIIPSGRPAGAEIVGIDVAKGFNDATFNLIDDAFNKNGVLVFRHQKITEEDHIAFTKRFGDIGPNTFASYHAHPKFPNEMLIVSNIKENGDYLGNPDA
ncbi:MAG: TauD/TfdA dioxygenase family protein, partial [Rhodospirillales bacterium]